MSERLADTTLRQRRAAEPGVSAWVSANAGSGKTKVLSDRVLRLLLAGVAPARILCLTFTRAAAANMAMRVFDRLGEWVTLDDAALSDKLFALEGGRPDAARLALARRLFARAVETPGGLKIGTIHAFCERLLHIAPFEARTPARFSMLDDMQAGALFDEALAEAFARSAHDERLRAAFDALDAAIAGGDGRDRLLRAALRRRAILRDDEAFEEAIEALRAALALGEDEDGESLRAAILDGGIPVAEWADIVATLQTGKKTDVDRAACFVEAAAARNPEARYRAYRSVFFKPDGDPYASLATKSVPEALKERLLAEQARIMALDERIAAVEAFTRTRALFVVARDLFRRIEERKARLGLLDFDDLIERTLELLRSPAGAWVLYKLDRGVDHVLVDEAQDTNPEQWEILREITGDFFAGEGQAAGRTRTVFAVGDEKQSIYSFQGAEPRKFSESRRHWERLAGQVAAAFETISLTVSFRSAPGVLAAVDQVFSDPGLFRGLSFEDGATGTAHQSAWPDIPSAVELWPFEPEADEEEADAWTHPVDEPEGRAPAVRLARKVAQAVRTWTTTGDALGRVWRPGDVLILLRGRNAAFFATIRALKDAGVPVAGADRLDIADHIAVQDLVAAGRAALLPDDDLTLAAALKSPLVGFDDDDLVRVAAGRGADVSLVEAMRVAAEAGDVAAIRGCAALDSWRDLARSRGPFRFYAEMLGPLGGRRRLVARLGAEAGDAIDAFLAEALTSEHPTTPSLAQFLAGFAGSEREIKRDLEAGGEDVRVMTIHGAKGLEAPVVVLVDPAYAIPDGSPGLFDVGAPAPVWSPSAKADCRAAALAREESRARQEEERNRLLYVALTRAADHLVIAPFARKGAKEFGKESWGARIEAALSGGGLGLAPVSLPYGDAMLWRDPDAPARPRAMKAPPPASAWEVPAWLDRPAAPEPEPAPPIRPSSALTAADQPRRPRERPFDAIARLRGVLVHALLERLPGVARDRRRAAAEAFVAARAGGLSQQMRERIVADALAVIDDPRLAALFSPGSLAEAPVAGEVALGEAGARAPVAGQIDRLAVTEEAVFFADFKTGARPPADGAPRPGQLTQMALYGALLSAIYPGRAVRGYLVWTAGPLVTEIPQAALEAALRDITPV